LQAAGKTSKIRASKIEARKTRSSKTNPSKVSLGNRHVLRTSPAPKLAAARARAEETGAQSEARGKAAGRCRRRAAGCHLRQPRPSTHADAIAAIA
jgi:hypothetical protein